MSNFEVKQFAQRHLESLLRETGLTFDSSPIDRGIDLTVSPVKGSDSGRNSLCRVKVMANQNNRFGVQVKWGQIANLLLVFVWDVSSDSAEIYALSYEEAVTLLEERGHTRTKSWKVLGGYTVRVGEGDQGKWWRTHLSSHRMDADKLREKIDLICGS